MCRGGDTDGTTEFFTRRHIPAPHFFAVVAGLTEFFGGLMMLTGLPSVDASRAHLVNMVLAIATFNHANGFSVESPWVAESSSSCRSGCSVRCP